MGSSTSKAASSAARKYPTRTPTTPPPSSKLRPRTQAPAAAAATNAQSPFESQSSTQYQSQPQPQSQSPSDPSSPKDSALSARLRQLGPVTPSGTLSHSSTFNTNSLRSPNLPPSPSHARSSPSPSSSTRPSEHQGHDMSFAPSASSPSQSIFPSALRTNPAIALLEAREALQVKADKEFEDLGRQSGRDRGREFLDVATIRSVLVMIAEGREAAQIEGALGLRKGVVGRLRNGVFGITGV